MRGPRPAAPPAQPHPDLASPLRREAPAAARAAMRAIAWPLVVAAVVAAVSVVKTSGKDNFGLLCTLALLLLTTAWTMWGSPKSGRRGSLSEPASVVPDRISKPSAPQAFTPIKPIGMRKPVYIVVVHFAQEASSEAALITQGLRRLIGEDKVLVGNNHSESAACAQIEAATAVLWIQSRNGMNSARVLLQLLTALDASIPIVAARIVNGRNAYDEAETAAFLSRLDSKLAPEEADALRVYGRMLIDSAWSLSQRLPLVRACPIADEQDRLAEKLLELAMDAGPLPPAPLLMSKWFRMRSMAERSLTPRTKNLVAGRQSSCYSDNIPASDKLIAEVPDAVPRLPVTYDATGSSRAKVLLEIKQIISAPETTSSSQAVVLLGRGGAGKTTLTAAIVRDESVRRRFEAVKWLTVGETPNLTALRQELLQGLDPLADPRLSGDELAMALSRALRGRTLLLVLDDVWHPEHASALCRLDESTTSVCIISSRVSKLMRGAIEVRIDKMDESEAVALLLRSAHRPFLLADPPKAALEVVNVCGCMPLLLVIVGGMIATCKDESWVDWVPERLRSNYFGTVRSLEDSSNPQPLDGRMVSIEERVITQSLNVATSRVGINGHLVHVLFEHFAAFPEDAAVPAAALDALAPMIVAHAAQESASDERAMQAAALRAAMSRYPARLVLRSSLLTLIRHSLVQGSVVLGVSTHDIIRGYALQRADAAPGGMTAMQRRVLAALLKSHEQVAEDDPESSGRVDVVKYLRLYLGYHVQGAIDHSKPLLDDPLIMGGLINHPDESIRRLIALGLSLDRVEIMAAQAEARENRELSSQLWLTASGICEGRRGGDNRRRACAVAASIDPPTRQSVALEALAYMGLFSKAHGIVIGSDEFHEAGRRLEVLRDAMLQSGNVEVEELTFCLEEARFMVSYQRLCYTDGRVLDVNQESVAELALVRREVLATAPSRRFRQCLNPVLDHSDHAVEAFSVLLYATFTRVHLDPSYNWDEEYGKNGSKLYTLISKYSHDTVHFKAKASYARDPASCGLAGSLLLLHWGDILTAQRDWETAATCWSFISRRQKMKLCDWTSYPVDLMDVRATRAVCIAVRDFEPAITLFEHSIDQELISEEDTSELLSRHEGSLLRWMRTWKMEATLSASSILLRARAVHAILHSETGPEHVGSWLPSPEDLIALAERERAWDMFLVGPEHPSVACALIYEAQKLTHVALKLAEALLKRMTQPLVVIELRRLCARCLPPDDGAEEHLREAVKTAACAGYLWMEILLFRDLFSLTKAERWRVKLGKRLRQIRSPLQEVTPYLGNALDAADLVAELQSLPPKMKKTVCVG